MTLKWERAETAYGTPLWLGSVDGRPVFRVLLNVGAMLTWRVETRAVRSGFRMWLPVETPTRAACNGRRRRTWETAHKAKKFCAALLVDDATIAALNEKGTNDE